MEDKTLEYELKTLALQSAICYKENTKIAFEATSDRIAILSEGIKAVALILQLDEKDEVAAKTSEYLIEITKRLQELPQYLSKVAAEADRTHAYVELKITNKVKH